MGSNRPAQLVQLHDVFRVHRRDVPVLHVLVVEDQPSTRMVLDLVLRNAGHKVFMYDDPEEALERLADVEMDLLVLDIHLNGMRGTDFLKQLRFMQAGGRTTPAIFITGDRSPAALKEAETVGGAYVLAKPLRPDALLEAIAALAVRAPAAGQDQKQVPVESQLQLLRESGLGGSVATEFVCLALQDLSKWRQHLEAAMFSRDADAWNHACEAMQSTAVAIEEAEVASAAGGARSAFSDAARRRSALRTLDRAMAAAQERRAGAGAAPEESGDALPGMAG